MIRLITEKRTLIIINSILIVLIIATIACIITLAAVPPVSRDALTHHLYIPKLYIQAGGIHEIPHIPFSYYPQLLDLIYILPLLFQNDILPKYIHFSFALATSLLIFIYLKRTTRTAAYVGVLFFLTIPVIMKLSVTAYVDLGLVFFSFAAIFYLLKWKEENLKWRYLIISAVFTGLAMGTKYNGMLTFLILTLTLPILLPINQRRSIKAFIYPIVFSIIALSVFSPWMIKNIIWTGNPLYPLYKTKISITSNSNQQEPGFDEALNEDKNRFSHFLIRKHLYHETWWETLLIPIRIFFQGEDDNPARFDGKLNPFLFIMPAILSVMLLFRKNYHDSNLFFLFLFSILFTLFAFLKTDMRIRYISPIIPPLVLLYVEALGHLHALLIKKFHHRFTSAPYIFSLIIIVASFSSNIVYTKELFLHINPIEYISGRISRKAYINKFRPEYELIEYLNKNAKKDAKVLALFLGNRGYYFDRDVRFSKNDFFTAVQQSSSDDDIAKQLKDKGYTHIMICFDLYRRWAQHSLQQKDFEKSLYYLKRHAEPLRQNRFYGLYSIL